MTATPQASKGPWERLAGAVRCTGVQLAAARLPVRSPSLVAQHGDALALILLALPTAAIDWQITVTWALSAWIPAAGACLVTALIVIMLARPQTKALTIAAVVGVLYALPVAGAILRWHLVASPQALIGDGAYQTQLAGDFLLKGIDPYGADYGRAGLAATPWGESFPSPALHHLVTWPGQFLFPLPIQALSRLVFGWWDERVFLLVGAAAIWLLLGALFPGIPGRMAAVALFLVPGHSLLAVLGDNDLPVVALLLAGLLAAQRRRFLLMGLLLGCAIVTKQHALLAVPLIVTWAVVRGADRRTVARAAVIATAVVGAFLLPFVVWDAAAFGRDTVVFLIGGGTDTYPINGFGLSAMLLSAGVVQGSRDAFPFALLELVAAGALWTAAWVWLRRRLALADVLILMGLVFASVLFVSRYFHDTHLLLGVELMLAGLATRAWRTA
jgi:Glycosyltransferase family 87